MQTVDALRSLLQQAADAAADTSEPNEARPAVDTSAGVQPVASTSGRDDTPPPLFAAQRCHFWPRSLQFLPLAALLQQTLRASAAAHKHQPPGKGATILSLHYFAVASGNEASVR